MSFIGINLKKIRSIKQLSQSAFADIFDLKRASIGSYEEERAEPKIIKIIEIANYFSISLNDFLQKELSVNEISGFAKKDREMLLTKGNNLLKDKKEKKSEFIDYVKGNDYGAFLNSVVNKKLYSGKKLQKPFNFNDNSDLAYELSDNSMNFNGDGIMMGDIVICEGINISDTFSKYIYLIVTNNNMFLRKMSKRTENSLTLEAINENFQPVIIKTNSIVSIYKLNGIIKNYVDQLL